MKELKYPLFRLITVNIFLVTLLYSSTACNAQSKSRGSLLALSKGDHTLAIVDASTLKVIKRIPVGSDPHEVIASSEDKGYSYIPKGYTIPTDVDYFHITTNNTIYGTQWQDLSLFYDKKVPLVADMSSDILSRQLDFNKFDLIYAGAQKNIGAAGVNIVVVNKACLGKVSRSIPTMLDYREHIAAGSMLNTPPVFAIYVCMLTLRWLKNNGGITEAEKRNNKKATLLYDTIDRYPVFKGTVAKEDRSKMNACFVLEDAEVEKELMQVCKEEGIIGITGHRSVGGFRISMYNALPYESVVVLTDIMKHVAEKKV